MLRISRIRDIFLLAMLSMALANCAFVDLGRELEKMNSFSAIAGTIEHDNLDGSPIAVVLFQGGMTLKHIVNAKLIEKSTFRFAAPPGDYLLFAFEDTNGDFLYQSHETAGYFGRPTFISLKPGTDRTDIRITLDKHFSLTEDADLESTAQDVQEAKLPNLWHGAKNIGAITSLDDPRFDPKFSDMGLWKPLEFSLEVGPGLFLLEPYDSGKIPVLFVHGIGSSPRAWRTVIKNLDRSRFQPWVFSYASGLPLEANATYLSRAMTELKIIHEFEKLYIVAHSMGGLVSQAFISKYRASQAQYLKLFVTLSTPWSGHSAAQLGVDYAPAVVPAWRDMAPNSEFLDKLQKSQLPSDLPYHLLFSYRGGSIPSRTANDGSVSVASQLDHAAQSRANKVLGFDIGHVDILSDKAAIRYLVALFDQQGGEKNKIPHQTGS